MNCAQAIRRPGDFLTDWECIAYFLLQRSPDVLITLCTVLPQVVPVSCASYCTSVLLYAHPRKLPTYCGGITRDVFVNFVSRKHFDARDKFSDASFVNAFNHSSTKTTLTLHLPRYSMYRSTPFYLLPLLMSWELVKSGLSAHSHLWHSRYSYVFLSLFFITLLTLPQFIPTNQHSFFISGVRFYSFGL